MAEDGLRMEHPNRERAAAKGTRAAVVALLLASAVVVLAVAVGGWARLEGAKGVLMAFVVAYAVTAVLVARWSRGALPVSAGLAIVLAIFAGVSTPAWFARDKAGFASPAIDESVLGLPTGLLVPVQLLLIALALRGFQQAWHVEVERHAEPGLIGANLR